MVKNAHFVEHLVFWSSLTILFYIYVGYPLLLVVLARWKGRTTQKANITPKVSVIVAAHNEEPVIREKIQNILMADYPPELLDVVVVSDGSTDWTNPLVQAMTDRRIKFYAYHPRRGKAYALNQAAGLVTGEILIFSDANVLCDKEAIRNLVRNFADPSVGAVCGKVLLTSSRHGEKEPSGEGFYMRYEGFLHEKEGQVHTMVGIDGAMYAIRAELFEPLPERTIIDDFVIAMRAPQKGRRIVYEPEARGVEFVVPSVSKEYKRKVRMIAGGYQAIELLRFLLNPLKSPLLVFQFVSHKVLRWLSPFFLIGLLLSNLFLVQESGFGLMFVGQLVFYGCACLGFVSGTLRQYKIFYVPYYFCATNIAALHGLGRYLLNQQSVTWEKARR
jgi:biofilm PGA synthesis N-glycosyltransferase PgaC